MEKKLLLEKFDNKNSKNTPISSVGQNANTAVFENDLLVSVIIPVYNVRPYICESIESAINQSYENIEIIIIDDGSTDGSGQICDQYAEIDRRIKVFHQENRGLSAARNFGLNAMTGDAVAFLDSDDSLHPDFILFMIETMLREEADIVVCQFSVNNTTSKMQLSNQDIVKPLIQKGISNRINALQTLVESTNNHIVWNKLYRQSIWQNIRFPEGHVYEDVDTTFRVLSQSERIYYLDQVLYLYRVRPCSITDTFSFKFCQDRLSAYSNLESFVDEHTPVYFTDEQACAVKKQYFTMMMNIYIQFYRSKVDDEKEFIQNLKTQIISIGKSIDNMGWSNTIMYNGIRYCSGLLAGIYFVYHPIHRLIIRAFQRKKSLGR